MGSRHSFADYVRSSTRLARETALLNEKARETITLSALIIDRSRELLAAWSSIDVSARFGSMLNARAANIPAKPQVDLRDSPPAKPPVTMERLVGCRFTGEIVRLDARHFVDCTITNCTLDYSGGPVILEGTHFTGCSFRFAGKAAMTISMLECFGLIRPQSSATPGLPSPALVN